MCVWCNAKTCTCIIYACTCLWSSSLDPDTCINDACLCDAVLFGDILSWGGAAAGASKGMATVVTGCFQLQLLCFHLLFGVEAHVFAPAQVNSLRRQGKRKHFKENVNFESCMKECLLDASKSINPPCSDFKMFCPNTNPYRISVLIKYRGQSCLVGGDNN